jgi:hypothetical protein
MMLVCGSDWAGIGDDGVPPSDRRRMRGCSGGGSDGP